MRLVGMNYRVGLSGLPGHQRGVASLVIAIILLVAITLVTLYTARTAVMEQRISANEIRAKAALEAAQAGLDYAVDYMTSVGTMDKCDTTDNGNAPCSAAELADPDDSDEAADVLTNARVVLDSNDPGAGYAASYMVTFCDATAYALPAAQPTCAEIEANSGACPTPPASPDVAAIYSCGWSDDGVALQMVSQVARKSPAFANVPRNPLTAHSYVQLDGSSTITNYYTNLNIWTGESTGIGSNSGKTFIRNPNVPMPAIDADLPANPSSCTTTANYVCTTDKNKTGPDVVANDTTLSSLTDDEFFENFFGTGKDSYHSNYVTMDLTGDTVGAVNANPAVQNEVIWVQDNDPISLPSPATIGSRDYPVIVVIDGDLVTSNVMIYGILYVLGNVNVQGNLEVHGAAIVEGNVSGTGSLDIVFDPKAVNNASLQPAPVATLAGTWRDWF